MQPRCAVHDALDCACRAHGPRGIMAVMSRLMFASAAIIIGLAGCGGERSESKPAASPSDVEVEFNDDSDFVEEEEEASETEATTEEEEPVEEESTEAEAPAEPEPPPPTCAELPEKTCQITKGCAWSTDKKCVEQ